MYQGSASLFAVVIGKETTGSKQVIQFHYFFSVKLTKNQRFWQLVSNQLIKDQFFLANLWLVVDNFRKNLTSSKFDNCAKISDRMFP